MKYSEQIVQDIEEGLKAGLSQKSVCDYVGISHETFYRWIDEKSEFNDRIKKAQSVKKKELLEKIEKAGAQSWTAYAWILERCYHKEFGPKAKFEHDIKAQFSHMTEEEKQAEIERLLSIRNSRNGSAT